jgi:hypothetical protein
VGEEKLVEVCMGECVGVSRKRVYDEMEESIEERIEERVVKRRRVVRVVSVLRSVCVVLGGVEGICVGMSRVSMRCKRRIDNMSMRSMKMSRVLEKKLKKK